MDIISISVIAITGVVISLVLKQSRPEFVPVISLICIVIIFSFGISKINSIIEIVKNMKKYVNIKEKYVVYIIKIIGISYISEFTSDLCKDAGQNAMAVQVEIFGKISILVISMPVILALMETVSNML